MEAGAVAAMITVLLVAVIAIVFLVRRMANCPRCPPGAAAVSFWTLPDGAGVPTTVACPPGTAISVQNADLGAPWGSPPCAWADVTAQAGALMNGLASYSIPASTSLDALLGVADACPGVTKTFAGSYACV
jgi:hypothetical protein